MEPFALTKEEFITRSMQGEVFISVEYGTRFYFDPKYSIPFRVEESPLEEGWNLINSTNLFTVEPPKPKIERRWKYLKNNRDGRTMESAQYYSDSKVHEYLDLTKWYKAEDCFIDVELKDN